MEPTSESRPLENLAWQPKSHTESDLIVVHHSKDKKPFSKDYPKKLLGIRVYRERFSCFGINNRILLRFGGTFSLKYWRLDDNL